ncbi:MAG: segregation/condensation protein A [Nanoarchaeota archaeon]
MESQAKLFDIIFNEDEISWQSMIHKLVREEGMNPWDINISHLAKKFLERLQKLKKMDFRISGKAILAAAILLRIKSRRLVGEDFNNLDRLIAMTDNEPEEDDIFEEIEGEFLEDIEDDSSSESMQNNDYKLNPRTPLPRKRKVSVYDLVDALHKALEVKKRRTNRLTSNSETDVKTPEKQKDITLVIQEVYDQIREYIAKRKSKTLMFSQFVSEDCTKNEKIGTFTPLLYLDNQRKIDLYQESHLADIEIKLNWSK